MKKLLLVATLAFGFVATSAAQETTFGLKAGLNLSNAKFKVDGISASPDGRAGFYIGGLVDFGISEKFHIQPEVLYSSEGVDEGEISFVNIPVLAKYYVMEGLSIQAGPQLGILLDADGGTEAFKKTNFGLNIGAGYELAGGIFFDARYTIGVSNIADIDGSDLGVNDF